VRIVSDTDQALRRFERDAVLACGAMALLALAAERGRPDGAAGVVAGGALAALSYWAIKRGVDALVSASGRPGPPASARGPSEEPRRSPAAPAGRDGASPSAAEAGGGPGDGPSAAPGPPLSAGRRIGLAVTFLTRYALLAVGAYVMLMRFRVHPVGVLAGATTPFVAALVQVVRWSRTTSHREHP
jgi:hypothetical protein